MEGEIRPQIVEERRVEDLLEDRREQTEGWRRE